ncbi:MAG: hypothetical protein RMK52_06160 [Chitinophagales bacterium]|nr:hypothetical protein [Chitinophagales bacterium]MDW8393810.1 hypothetical protein [Chitinophagales bacterium]
MDPTFTPNDLIRFLFHEMPSEEAHAFRQWLQEHPARQEELNRLQQTIEELRQVPDGPSETSVQLVLAYSRQTALEHA